LIPFFILYKKFGFKLFILVFSVFGFTLSFTASGGDIFRLFRVVSVLAVIVCIFIYSFRPNLVLSIKNKLVSGNGPIDIRRSEYMNKIMEFLSLVIGAVPVAIFWGVSILNIILNRSGSFNEGIFGSIMGGVISGILPVVISIILGIIFSLIIVRFAQSNNRGMDSGFAEVIPTEETESAIREIGAIIGDIQELGDSGLEKWIKNPQV